MQQVVSLENPLVRSMRVPLEHSRHVEVPYRRAGHHVQSQWAEDSKIHGRVNLLHEAGYLRPATHAAVDSPRADEPLHEELAGEGQDDCIEGYEGEVEGPLAVHCGARGVIFG